MVIHNWFLIIIAILQAGSGIWYFVKLDSPLLGTIQILYAICNVIFSMMKGL